MKEFMSTFYSFDYNGNEEDERDELSPDEEINLLITNCRKRARARVKW